MPVKKKRERPEPERLVKRPREDRKRLDPRYEDLASGESDRVARPRPRAPGLRDDRAIALVPGVKNADARAIFDARLTDLQKARAGHPDDPEKSARLAALLAEAICMRLWRAGSLTSFDALAEQLLDLPASEARELAERGASASSVPLDGATELAIAGWMRVEAALLEGELRGRARIVRIAAGKDRLVLELPADEAAPAFAEIGRRLAALARDLE